MADETPRIWRVRQTRTGRWVGEAHTPDSPHREWTALSGGNDHADARANVIDDFCRRRGQLVQFEGEDTVYGPDFLDGRPLEVLNG